MGQKVCRWGGPAASLDQNDEGAALAATTSPHQDQDTGGHQADPEAAPSAQKDAFRASAKLPKYCPCLGTFSS